MLPCPLPPALGLRRRGVQAAVVPCDMSAFNASLLWHETQYSSDYRQATPTVVPVHSLAASRVDGRVSRRPSRERGPLQVDALTADYGHNCLGVIEAAPATLPLPAMPSRVVVGRRRVGRAACVGTVSERSSMSSVALGIA